MQFVRLYGFIFDLKLNPSEFSILAYLLKFRDRCYPSQKNIALKTMQSERAVRRSLEVLKNRGLVTWQRGNTGRSNYYQVHLPFELANKKSNPNASNAETASIVNLDTDIPDAAPSEEVPLSSNQVTSIEDFFNQMGLPNESE